MVRPSGDGMRIFGDEIDQNEGCERYVDSLRVQFEDMGMWKLDRFQYGTVDGGRKTDSKRQ